MTIMRPRMRVPRLRLGFPLGPRRRWLRYSITWNRDQSADRLGRKLAPLNCESTVILADDLAFNGHSRSLPLEHPNELHAHVREEAHRKLSYDEGAAYADVDDAPSRGNTRPCPQLDGSVDFVPVSPAVFHITSVRVHPENLS
jgi:hypothetical protein